jgi:hypothetical protein
MKNWNEYIFVRAPWRTSQLHEKSPALQREYFLKKFFFIVAFSSSMDRDPTESEFTKMIRVSLLNLMGRIEWFLVYPL